MAYKFNIGDLVVISELIADRYPQSDVWGITATKLFSSQKILKIVDISDEDFDGDVWFQLDEPIGDLNFLMEYPQKSLTGVFTT